MTATPDVILEHHDDFCARHGKTIVDLRDDGVDAFVRQTDENNIPRVFRRPAPFAAERAVYERLLAAPDNITNILAARLTPWKVERSALLIDGRRKQRSATVGLTIADRCS